MLGCGALYLLVRWEGRRWGRGLTECHAWLRGGFGGEDGGMKAGGGIFVSCAEGEVVRVDGGLGRSGR